MGPELFHVESAGMGLSLQDRGVLGWRRYGVPPGGAMDDHAAEFANRLLDNPPGSPVLEMLLQGARLRVQRHTWIAHTGADLDANVPPSRAVELNPGDVLSFPGHRSGVWSYLAVPGGLTLPEDAAPLCARSPIGALIPASMALHRASPDRFHLTDGVAGRVLAWEELRDYRSPPVFQVWPGPQWDAFAPSTRAAFFDAEWSVTSQSNRVGYRLSGPTLLVPEDSILSEPVRVGTIQIPGNGQPIVTMRDGPTVGGYLKLGMIDPAQISWLAQCLPGQTVRFEPIARPS